VKQRKRGQQKQQQQQEEEAGEGKEDHQQLQQQQRRVSKKQTEKHMQQQIEQQMTQQMAQMKIQEQEQQQQQIQQKQQYQQQRQLLQQQQEQQQEKYQQQQQQQQQRMHQKNQHRERDQHHQHKQEEEQQQQQQGKARAPAFFDDSSWGDNVTALSLAGDDDAMATGGGGGDGAVGSRAIQATASRGAHRTPSKEKRDPYARKVTELNAMGSQTPSAVGTYTDDGTRVNSLKGSGAGAESTGRKGRRVTPYRHNATEGGGAGAGRGADRSDGGDDASATSGGGGRLTQQQQLERQFEMQHSAQSGRVMRSPRVARNGGGGGSRRTGGYEEDGGRNGGMDVGANPGFSPQATDADSRQRPSVADIQLDQDFGEEVMGSHAIKSETFDYLKAEDILPSPAPGKEMSKVSSGIVTDEWPDIFHTINSARRLALHHPNALISSGNLHTIVRGVIKQVENLRSAVAKNAILCLQDMCAGLGRTMDSEIVNTASCLAKRYADTSGFLGESAEQALFSMIDNVSATRALGALTAASENRNALIRGRCAVMIHALVSRRGSEVVNSREMDGLRVRLAKLLSDQGPEARTYARRIVHTLVNERHMSRTDLEQTIPAEQIDKALREDNDMSMVGSGVGYLSPKVASSPSRRAIAGRSRSTRKSPQVSKSLNFGGDDGEDGAAVGGGAHQDRKAAVGGMSMNAPLDSLGETDDHALDISNLRINTGRGGANVSSMGSSMGSMGSMGSSSSNNSSSNSNSNSNSHSHSHSHSAGHVEQDEASTLAAPSPHLIGSKRTPSGSRNATVVVSGLVGTIRRLPTGSSPDTDGGGAKTKSASPGKSRAAAKRQMDNEPALMQLPQWLNGLQQNNWLDRVDSLTSLTDAVIQFTDMLKGTGKLAKVLDCIVERLEDGSVKCALHTLQCLQKIFNEKPALLCENKLTVGALMASASSSNRQIARDASEILEGVLDQTSPSAALSQLTSMALHDKDRLRAAAFRKLADRVEQFHAISDSTLRRSLFPAVSKTLLASNTKAEVRVAAAEAVKAIQKAIGTADQVHTWVSDYTQREEIRRITAAL
jgi:hypothetical protein